MKGPTGHNFEKLAPYYDQALKILLLPFGGEGRLRKAILSFLEGETLLPKARILEVGSGTASNLKAIDQAFPARFELIAVDSSPAMLAKAQKKKFSSQIKFFLTDATSLPFKSQTIDLALLVFALHELKEEKRSKALEETYRVLKNQGLLLLADFSFPQNKIGKALFSLLHLFETREALNFARTSFTNIISPFPFSLKKEGYFLFDLVRMALYQKSKENLNF